MTRKSVRKTTLSTVKMITCHLDEMTTTTSLFIQAFSGVPTAPSDYSQWDRNEIISPRGTALSRWLCWPVETNGNRVGHLLFYNKDLELDRFVSLCVIWLWQCKWMWFRLWCQISSVLKWQFLMFPGTLHVEL